MVCLSNYYFGASYALFQYLFFIFLFIPQLSVKRLFSLAGAEGLEKSARRFTGYLGVLLPVFWGKTGGFRYLKAVRNTGFLRFC